ncbi:flagellar hook-basal body complex protein FliE [Fusibacter bizertensis]|uniref:Flagellar hook-basal body complex protein FliE n=1 Tax=Fusibacter bizertensis TaxID=1488331 RepID=A0ABT6N8A2_9FIRM|nr:flagellar hook-basal body complex protein FliE [Fusibacter bizertensis]MDH8676636.1 flagellar hook-basal body complex protein FliE [Fusibacter bizertensis]
MKIDQLQNSILVKDKKLIDINNTLQDESVNFSELLAQSLQKVSDDQLYSEKMDSLFSIGAIDNVSDVTIAAMKADLSINLAVEVTNKVLAAYSEIMRLQL